MNMLDLVDDALDAYRGSALGGVFLGHTQWGRFCAEVGVSPALESVTYRSVQILKGAALASGTMYLVRQAPEAVAAAA